MRNRNAVEGFSVLGYIAYGPEQIEKTAMIRIKTKRPICMPGENDDMIYTNPLREDC